jgi:hypothetical protein
MGGGRGLLLIWQEDAMLREMATPEMVVEWKRTWEAWRKRLSPNRRRGDELVSYLRGKYPLREMSGECHVRAIRENVLANGFSREKLAMGDTPRPVAFVVEDVGAGSALYAKKDAVDGPGPILIGIDLATGEFQVEGSAALWDELFIFRGLDEADLENPFLVAQYVALKGARW